MKRCFPPSDDESQTDQSNKYSKSNSNNGRRLTFQLNDFVKETLPTDSKFKTHQSTPYPKQKLRQLQDSGDYEATSTTTTEIAEKRNPEFLNKLGLLNRSFIRWIDTYFNKGYNYDFTPVCNDYIRFINNLKEKYPIENSSTHSSMNNCLKDSSPVKNKLIFQKQSLTNTPPPNPGDKDYKSTPYPKHLINHSKSHQQDLSYNFGPKSKTDDSTSSLVSKFESKADQPTSSPVIKFEFSAQQKPSTVQSTAIGNEEKKEIKFPTLTTLNSSNESIFKINNQLGTTTSNPINENLFDTKPKFISNTNQLFSSPAKDQQQSTQAKPIDSNFFAPDNIFKTQLNPLAKTFDISSQSKNLNNSNLLTETRSINTETTETNDDENYVPPKPEVACVEENASYSVKCKLFLKKGLKYVEKGIGTLYIKETNEEAGNQLLIRGDNSLGTILLNIRLKQTLPIIPTKNGLLLSIPITTSDEKSKETNSETASFYIKVKTTEIRDELNSYIKKFSV